MADEKILDAVTTATENVVESVESSPLKRKPAEKPTASASKQRREPKAVASVEPSEKRRRYKDAERAEIIASINSSLAKGETLRASVKRVGVTEQSYYQWKKAAKAHESSGDSAPDDVSLIELIELESENKRLRTQLASQLRAENDELRKRLRNG